MKEIKNKYFEVPYPVDGRILSFCISQCEPRNHGGKAIVKLPIGAKIPSVLAGYKLLSQSEANKRIKEWTDSEKSL